MSIEMFHSPPEEPYNNERKQAPEPEPGNQLELTQRLKEVYHQITELGINLTEEQWAGLLPPKIELVDIANDANLQSMREKYSDINVIAAVSKERLVLDRRFEKLTTEQQDYLLLHELGHLLDQVWQTNPQEDKAAEIRRLIRELPQGAISDYVSHLENKASSQLNDAELDKEKIAELIAQYLFGKRTFPGMMKAKLFKITSTLEGRSGEEVDSYNKLIQELDSLASDQTDEEFLAEKYPALVPHYQLWQKLDTLFSGPDILGESGEAASGFDWKEEWVGIDGSELVSPPPTDQIDTGSFGQRVQEDSPTPQLLDFDPARMMAQWFGIK